MWRFKTESELKRDYYVKGDSKNTWHSRVPGWWGGAIYFAFGLDVTDAFAESLIAAKKLGIAHTNNYSYDFVFGAPNDGSNSWHEHWHFSIEMLIEEPEIDF